MVLLTLAAIESFWFDKLLPNLKKFRITFCLTARRIFFLKVNKIGNLLLDPWTGRLNGLKDFFK